MSAQRVQLIRTRLEERLAPLELTIKDQSQLHIGHAGARDGKGHFDITIVSAAFAGESRLKRHQMIYDALGDMLESDIHALRIKALTPSER